MELEHLQQDKQHDGCTCVNLDLYGLVEQMEIYIYIWVNYNISLTWIVRPFGHDFPEINHDSSEGEQWGRYNLPSNICINGGSSIEWRTAYVARHSQKDQVLAEENSSLDVCVIVKGPNRCKMYHIPHIVHEIHESLLSKERNTHFCIQCAWCMSTWLCTRPVPTYLRNLGASRT